MGQREIVIPVDAGLAREALNTDGQLLLPVRGGSMGPWLVSGDVVEVEPALDLCRGDIVVFEQAGRLVAHRVVGRRPGGWLTRGDAKDRPDPFVEDERVVGRVRGLHARWLHLATPPVWLRRGFGRCVLRVSPALVRARSLVRP